MPVDQIEKKKQTCLFFNKPYVLICKWQHFSNYICFILTITFNSLKAYKYKCIYKFTSQNEEKIYLRIHQYVQLVLLIFNC